MKIAVVGSGISGLSAAYYLSKKHHVDIFEKEDHFGGHSHTIDLHFGSKKIVRGGAWCVPYDLCNSKYRNAQIHETQYQYIGFR